MLRERRIGLGVVIVVVLIAVAVIGVLIAREQQALKYTLVFRDAQGVRRGDRVQMSGVDIGVVKDVRLQGTERIEVDLRVQPKFAETVRADATGVIRNVSLPNVSGQKVVEVINPEVDTPAVPMADDQIVEGVNGMIELELWKVRHTLHENRDRISGTIGALGTQLRAMVKEFDEIAASPEVRRAIDDLRRFAGEMAREGQSGAGKMIKEWHGIMEEVAPLLRNLNDEGQDVLVKTLRALLREIDATLRRWQAAEPQLAPEPIPTLPPEAI